MIAKSIPHFVYRNKSNRLNISPLEYSGPISNGTPPGSSGSVLDHRSLQPVFESRRGHISFIFDFASLHLEVGQSI